MGSFQTSQRLLGNLDELRIWHTVRSAEQIHGAYNRGLDETEYQGLAAYYRFDQGAGIGKDLSGHGYDATLGGFGRTAPSPQADVGLDDATVIPLSGVTDADGDPTIVSAATDSPDVAASVQGGNVVLTYAAGYTGSVHVTVEAGGHGRRRRRAGSDGHVGLRPASQPRRRVRLGGPVRRHGPGQRQALPGRGHRADVRGLWQHRLCRRATATGSARPTRTASATAAAGSGLARRTSLSITTRTRPRGTTTTATSPTCCTPTKCRCRSR